MSNQAENMQDRVLVVGLVVVDIVTVVEEFPVEDSKKRCDRIYNAIGGNAATNTRILSLLGEKSAFMGTVGQASSGYFSYVQEFFLKYNVDTTPWVLKNDPMPLSVCILNKATGSRTCIHYRGSIPELAYEDFIGAEINLSDYKWIHFEARYEYKDTKKQLDYLLQQRSEHNYSYKISIEIENPKCDLAKLISLADFVFTSKDFAKSQGFSCMEDTVTGLCECLKQGGAIICPWGEHGAAARPKDGELVTSCAFPPPKVVNSLGAGDTFIASCIKSLSNNRSLQDSLSYGCQVAGAKVGMSDLDQLAHINFS